MTAPNGNHPAAAMAAAAPIQTVNVNLLETPNGPVTMLELVTVFGTNRVALPADLARWLANQLTKTAAGLAPS